MSNLRKGRIALSILGVKGHMLVSVIQAEITRNQLPGMLGGIPPNMAVHEQSLSALENRTGTRVYAGLCCMPVYTLAQFSFYG